MLQKLKSCDQWCTQELSMGGVLKLKLDIMTSYSNLCEDIKTQTEYFNIESLCKTDSECFLRFYTY